MDSKQSLPTEYFNNEPTNLTENIGGSDIDISYDTPIDLDDSKKMIGDESDNYFSKPAAPYRSESTQSITPQNIESNNVLPNQNNISQDITNNKTNNNQDQILDEIRQLDDKLFQLEKALYEQSGPNNITQNPSLEANINDVGQNLVTREFPVEQTENNNETNNSFSNNEQFNADFVTGDSVSNLTEQNFTDNNTSNNDVIEVKNKNENITNNLVKEIENLYSIRNSLIKKISSLNNNKSTNTNLNNNENFVDNFTPNFAFVDDTEKQEAESRAVLTEQIYSGDGEVKSVTDDFGNDAIISKDQTNLEEAIKDHGGIDNALKDSAEQQSFVDNVYNSESENITENTDNINNNSFEDSNLNVSESQPTSDMSTDSLNDITKNTSATVVAINGLAKKIGDLASSLNNNFKKFDSSLKGIEHTTNNIVNNNGNNMGSPGNSVNPNPTSSKEKSTLPNNINGNDPFPYDFPEGFKPGGSNLANRM